MKVNIDMIIMIWFYVGILVALLSTMSALYYYFIKKKVFNILIFILAFLLFPFSLLYIVIYNPLYPVHLLNEADYIVIMCYIIFMTFIFIQLEKAVRPINLIAYLVFNFDVIIVIYSVLKPPYIPHF